MHWPALEYCSCVELLEAPVPVTMVTGLTGRILLPPVYCNMVSSCRARCGERHSYIPLSKMVLPLCTLLGRNKTASLSNCSHSDTHCKTADLNCLVFQDFVWFRVCIVKVSIEKNIMLDCQSVIIFCKLWV